MDDPILDVSPPQNISNTIGAYITYINTFKIFPFLTIGQILGPLIDVPIRAAALCAAGGISYNGYFPWHLIKSPTVWLSGAAFSLLSTITKHFILYSTSRYTYYSTVGMFPVIASSIQSLEKMNAKSAKTSVEAIKLNSTIKKRLITAAKSTEIVAWSSLIEVIAEFVACSIFWPFKPIFGVLASQSANQISVDPLKFENVFSEIWGKHGIRGFYVGWSPYFFGKILCSCFAMYRIISLQTVIDKFKHSVDRWSREIEKDAKQDLLPLPYTTQTARTSVFNKIPWDMLASKLALAWISVPIENFMLIPLTMLSMHKTMYHSEYLSSEMKTSIESPSIISLNTLYYSGTISQWLKIRFPWILSHISFSLLGIEITPFMD